MPTAWPTNLHAEYAADKAVRVGRARAIAQRSEVLIRQAFTVRVPTPTVGPVDRRLEILPSWLDRTMHALLNARITGGDGTSAGRARLKLRSQGGLDLVTGPWVAFTDITATGAELDLTVAVTTSAVLAHIFDFGHDQNVGLVLRAEVEKTAGPGTAQLLTGGVVGWVSD